MAFTRLSKKNIKACAWCNTPQSPTPSPPTPIPPTPTPKPIPPTPPTPPTLPTPNPTSVLQKCNVAIVPGNDSIPRKIVRYYPGHTEGKISGCEDYTQLENRPSPPSPHKRKSICHALKGIPPKQWCNSHYTPYTTAHHSGYICEIDYKNNCKPKTPCILPLTSKPSQPKPISSKCW